MIVISSAAFSSSAAHSGDDSELKRTQPSGRLNIK